MLDRNVVLQNLNVPKFYQSFIPSLKINGKAETQGICPFHDDHNPSLSVNIETGLYKCHACGAGGDPFRFYQDLKKVGFKTALKEIAKMQGIDELKPNIFATYDYRDETGNLLFQVVRMEPKTFRQRKPDGKGGWIWNTEGVRLVPYCLPEVIKATLVFIAEGEKDAETIRGMGLTGTTNARGAGKWRPEYNKYFKDKEVVILPDNDDPGRKHAEVVAQNLYGIARSIKVVELPGLPEKGDVSDWVKFEHNNKNKLLDLVKATPEWVHGNANINEDDWPDIIPFRNLSILPDFPVITLSDIGQEIVSIVSGVVQVDAALPATIYLAVLSAALAKKGKVDLNTHTEPLNVFTVCVLPPGERKTATMGILTKPLYDHQKWVQQEVSHEIKKARIIYEMNQEKIKTLQKRVAKEKDYIERERLEDELVVLAKNITEPPELPVCIVDDITPEELGRLMANNNERMAVFSTEGGIFGIMAGRYDDKKGGNIDLFLKGHSGDPWSCHRIGRESKTMLAPALTMGLTVQPDVMSELGLHKNFRGRGLLARPLYYIGKPHAGYRERQAKMIHEKTLEEYSQHISNLMNLPLSEQTLRLTPEAHMAWNEFYDDIEKEMRPGGDLEYLKDWGSKLAGQVARISGLLHYAAYGETANDTPVSVNSVNNSCVIGSFFKEHALAAFGLMQAHPGIEAAKTILNYISRERIDKFKGRDVIRHTGIRTMEDVTLGLNILLERGFIKEIDKMRTGVGRPEATSYVVNPKIYMQENS